MASQKECIIFPAGLKCKLCRSNIQLACYKVSGPRVGPADPQLRFHEDAEGDVISRCLLFMRSR